MIAQQRLENLLQRLDAIAVTGRQPDGTIYRPVYSPSENAAFGLVAGWMRAAGLAPRTDAAGNLIGRLEGATPGAPAIATGSHLDSVQNAGTLDGSLGVLSSLSAVEHLAATRGTPRTPLEVVVFRGEEGSRFPGGFIGSLAWAGRLAPEMNTVDPQGITMATALRASGGDPDALATARRTDLAAFLELHIEQGRVLETAAVPVGVVAGLVGIRWIHVRLHGQANHAGTTPMTLRRDPVLAAARIIDATTRLVADAGAPAVLTCGRLSASPGGTNIVAGHCDFTLDFRDMEPQRVDALYAQVRKTAAEIAAAHGVTMNWDEVFHQAPVPCDPQLQATLRAAAADLGIATRGLASGAGHDTQVLARLCPVAMLFVPSVGGVSHNPAEETRPADMAAGVAVLTRALERLAYDA